MLSNIKIGPKLIGSFLVVAFIALAIGVFGYFQIHKIDDADTVLYEKITMPLGDLADMSISFQRTRINLRDAVASKDEKETQTYWDNIKQLRQDTGVRSEKFEKSILTEEGRKLFAEFKESSKIYDTYLDKIKEFDDAKKDDEAMALMTGDAKKAALHEQELLNKLMVSKETQAKKTSDNNSVVANMSGRLMIGAAIVGSILAFVLGLIIARSISLPINTLAGQARQVAEGDLRVNIDHHSGDEVGDLCEAFRSMIGNLRNIINQVSDTSSQVASAANQLHSTAEQIATGAEEVAAQSATVATAGEEMSATSGDIAQNCQMASEGAQRASQTASDGAVIVERTVAVMGQIAAKVQETAKTVESLGTRSDQIGAIIGTIEDIADQTNLLALNAAIEAARAGEQGRGFAVVADEVRALAERTTRATKEIGEMIKAIQRETKGAVIAMEQGVSQVESGTEEAAKSGHALRDILEQVNDVAMQVNQIATAAEEQTATTSEISSNMHQITEVVQTTSQGAQESATAAAQLNGNAEELQRLVRQFKL
jgi:methyl-accepting chemotaxis protein